MAEQAHFSIGGSTAGRTIQCPAWVGFCKDLPRKSSTYATEGTAAHALLEKRLKNPGLNVWEVSHVEADGKPFDVDMAMRTYVEDAAREIEAVAKAMGAPVQSEVRFDLSHLLPDDLAHLTGHIGGTADAVLETAFENLVVIDFKYGQGVAVSAENNAQMRFYALGALAAAKFEPMGVTMMIIQPRTQGGTVSIETITVEELRAWWNDTLLPAVREVSSGSRFGTGDYCKFCPGQPTCPELAKVALSAAQVTFGKVLPVKSEVTLPAPADMATEHLRRAMDLSTLLGDWIKAVEAEVKDRLANGKAVAETIGWKLVEGRKSRKWKDEAVAAEALALLGSDRFEPQSLKTVAQIEKLVKQEKGKPSILDGLVDVSHGVALVPAADKRVAYNSAASTFTKVEI
jgi:hypothetical protein